MLQSIMVLWISIWLLWYLPYTLSLTWFGSLIIDITNTWSTIIITSISSTDHPPIDSTDCPPIDHPPITITTDIEYCLI